MITEVKKESYTYRGHTATIIACHYDPINPSDHYWYTIVDPNGYGSLGPLNQDDTAQEAIDCGKATFQRWVDRYFWGE